MMNKRTEPTFICPNCGLMTYENPCLTVYCPTCKITLRPAIEERYLVAAIRRAEKAEDMCAQKDEALRGALAGVWDGHYSGWVRREELDAAEQHVKVLQSLIYQANNVGYGTAFTLQIERIQKERDAAKAEVGKLRRALLNYGEHRAHCALGYSDNGRCSCGFEEAKQAFGKESL